jgi:hypothetical protein
MAMHKRSTRDERRGADRPSVGDWKPCQRCAAGMVVFTEKYPGSTSAASSNPSPNVTMPAWVCDQCSNVTFVRASQASPARKRRD